MFLKTKEIAYTGMLMAIAVLLMILGGYFEGSTLFFLAAASFLAGIIEKNFSVVTAFVFLVGSTFLGGILAPQKLYCATFAAFGVYVILAEFLERRDAGKERVVPIGLSWAIKAVVYHVLLFAAVFLADRVLGFDAFLQLGWVRFLRQYQFLFFVVLVLGAEFVWIVFDRAYIYFVRRYAHYFVVKE